MAKAKRFIGSIGINTARTKPPAPVAAGGGGGGAAGGAGWEDLTAAKMVSGYSAGAADGYAGTKFISLTDNAGNVEMRFINTVASGGSVTTDMERLTVFWYDTGIEMSDVSSVELYLKHVGESGTPYGSNKQPMYGVVMGTSYFTPSSSAIYSAPGHFITIQQWFDSNKANVNRCIAVDDETFAGAGLGAGGQSACYAFIPVHSQGSSQLTTRDATMRPLHDTTGGSTSAAAKDLTTQYSATRYWTPTDTLKLGLSFGYRKTWKNHLQNEGFNIQIKYRVNKDRI